MKSDQESGHAEAIRIKPHSSSHGMPRSEDLLRGSSYRLGTLPFMLGAIEIGSYRLRPDEVRTYGRRVFSSGRWVVERGR